MPAIRRRPHGTGNPRPTALQAAVFAFLFTETARHGYQPSMREVCDHFGWAVPNAVLLHVRALRRKGWIAVQDHAAARSVRFLRRPDGGPFLGFTPILEIGSDRIGSELE